jgi:hypothetical protein
MSVTAVPLRPIAKGSLTKLWLGVGLVVLAAAGLAWCGTGAIRSQFATDSEFMAENASADGVLTTKSGLQYRVIRNGEGATAKEGQLTLVSYVGRLRDGSIFDQNRQAPLMVGGTVPGFDEALRMMPKGAKYEIWIPSELGYGSDEKRNPMGEVVIPADSMLHFELEMLDILSAEDTQKVMSGQMQQAPDAAH